HRRRLRPLRQGHAPGPRPQGAVRGRAAGLPRGAGEGRRGHRGEGPRRLQERLPEGPPARHLQRVHPEAAPGPRPLERPGGPPRTPSPAPAPSPPTPPPAAPPPSRRSAASARPLLPPRYTCGTPVTSFLLRSSRTPSPSPAPRKAVHRAATVA